jgi:hypothetical protein
MHSRVAAENDAVFSQLETQRLATPTQPRVSLWGEGGANSLSQAPNRNQLCCSVYVWSKLHIADWHRGGIRRKPDPFLLTPGPIGANIWWVFENRLAKGWSISNRGAI